MTIFRRADNSHDQHISYIALISHTHTHTHVYLSTQTHMHAHIYTHAL